MASGPITSWQMGKNVNGDRVSSRAPQSPWMVSAAIKLKDACFLEVNL